MVFHIKFAVGVAGGHKLPAHPFVSGSQVVAYTTLLKGLCEAGHIDESREVGHSANARAPTDPVGQLFGSPIVLGPCMVPSHNMQALKEMLKMGCQPNIRTANTS